MYQNERVDARSNNHPVLKLNIFKVGKAQRIITPPHSTAGEAKFKMYFPAQGLMEESTGVKGRRRPPCISSAAPCDSMNAPPSWKNVRHGAVGEGRPAGNCVEFAKRKRVRKRNIRRGLHVPRATCMPGGIAEGNFMWNFAICFPHRKKDNSTSSPTRNPCEMLKNYT